MTSTRRMLSKDDQRADLYEVGRERRAKLLRYLSLHVLKARRELGVKNEWDRQSGKAE